MPETQGKKKGVPFMRNVIAVYVENKYGVLARVSGLFMRRGFNIDSLTVGETDDPKYSRITVTLNGDLYTREQLINQLKKLHNVKQVQHLEDKNTVERELMLIKVRNTAEKRSEVMAAVQIYRARSSTTPPIPCVSRSPVNPQKFRPSLR